MKKKLLNLMELSLTLSQDLDDFHFILSYSPCLKAPAWGSNIDPN